MISARAVGSGESGCGCKGLPVENPKPDAAAMMLLPKSATQLTDGI
jgi:hypothetical protein